MRSLTKSKSLCCWEYLLLGIRRRKKKLPLSYGGSLEEGRIHYPAGCKVLLWLGRAIGNFTVFSINTFTWNLFSSRKYSSGFTPSYLCGVRMGGVFYRLHCNTFEENMMVGGVEGKFARFKSLNVFSGQNINMLLSCFGVSFFSNDSKKARCVLSTAWIICYKESILALLSYLPLHSSWMRKKEWEWQREECLVKNIEHFYR